MWSRRVVGFLLCVVGVVWIAQGTNLLHGSTMSGHEGYTALGALVLLAGIAVLVWTERRRKRPKEENS